MSARRVKRALCTVTSLVLVCLLTGSLGHSAAAQPPEIRTHDGNRVPSCVTPARLMRFMRERNPQLDQRFKDIAKLYKQHGEALRVRWDYAFFQMLLETNFLSYRAGGSRWGDVNPRQNNFAGIGTTGGGVPGDAFPDVSTGVLAQMQHLVAYSGEHVDNPAARRTREKQDDIISQSKALHRPVKFSDLTRRWATDRHYGRSIEAVAERYRAMFCSGKVIADDPDADEPKARAPRETASLSSATSADGDERQAKHGLGSAALATAAPALLSAPRPASGRCKVWTASYGGGKSILIRAVVDGEIHYTALQVLDGFERSLAEGYIRSHAKGGVPIGEFDSREAALSRAFDLCPSAQGKAQ